MKKIMAMITLVALMVGVNTIAFAEAKPLLVKESVDLKVTVSNWATISKLNPMAVTLAEPGKSETDSQKITVQTNTNVRVEASEPVLNTGSDQLRQAKATKALNWGLGFRKDDDLINLRIPLTWFELKAGSKDTRELVFWAEWKTDEWWELIAGDYSGTATVTVSAM